MSGKIRLAFGVVMLLAIAGLDYGSAANARLPGKPLGIAEHALTRFAQAKAALGLAPTDLAAGGLQTGEAKGAEGQIEAALAAANSESAAKMTNDAEAEPEATEPAATKRPARKKPGEITVGIGSCAKRDAGKFCSVGDS